MLKLFVGNLPPATRENDVRSLFAAFGTVRSAADSRSVVM